MPRTLPWLVGASKIKEVKKKDCVPQPRKRSPSAPHDLVTSDLDLIPSAPSTPEPKFKKRQLARSSSTSPPPALPDVSFMRDGLDADDIYRMVEDEFDSIARLFTQHLHHAEYVRLRRLHKSRGSDTLARLDHGTDSRTPKDRLVQMQKEAEEQAHKRKEATKALGAFESSDSDEDVMDPQLAGLMTGSQTMNPKRELAGLGKARSGSRAAAGLLPSPQKASRTKDVFKVQSGAFSSTAPHEDEETESEDDDLNLRPRKRLAMSTVRPNRLMTLNEPTASIDKSSHSGKQGFFKAFAEAKDGVRSTTEPSEDNVKSSPSLTDKPPLSFNAAQDARTAEPVRSNAVRLAEILARRRGTTKPPETQVKQETSSTVRMEKELSPSPTRWPSSMKYREYIIEKTPRTANIIAQERAGKMKQADSKAKTRATVDDIPTFAL